MTSFVNDWSENKYEEDEVENQASIVETIDIRPGVDQVEVYQDEDNFEVAWCVLVNGVHVAYVEKVTFYEEGHMYTLQEVIVTPSAIHVVRYPSAIISASALHDYATTGSSERRESFGSYLKPEMLKDTVDFYVECLHHHFDTPGLVHPLTYRERYDRFHAIQKELRPKLKETKNYVHYLLTETMLDVEHYVVSGGKAVFQVTQDHLNLFALLLHSPEPVSPVLYSLLEQYAEQVEDIDVHEVVKHARNNRLAEQGSSFHEYLERRLLGLYADYIGLESQEDYDAIDVFVERDSSEIEFVGLEVTLGSYREKICGKTDAIALCRSGEHCIIDWKRSNALREEIEKALQKRDAVLGDAHPESPFASSVRPGTVVRVVRITFSSLVFKYGFQLGTYRYLVATSNQVKHVTRFVYLCLFHPCLEQPYLWIEIDLATIVQKRGDAEASSIESRVQKAFRQREEELQRLIKL
jgi:hypothetical protein